MTDGKSGRLMSLDALRGVDMLFIMGFSGAIISFCAWIGLKDCWLATQMTHVAWHGFRHHDTIFPLFLFLTGVALLAKVGGIPLALMGVLAGELLRSGRFSGNRKTQILLGAGLDSTRLPSMWRCGSWDSVRCPDSSLVASPASATRTGPRSFSLWVRLRSSGSYCYSCTARTHS